MGLSVEDGPAAGADLKACGRASGAMADFPGAAAVTESEPVSGDAVSGTLVARLALAGSIGSSAGEIGRLLEFAGNGSSRREDSKASTDVPVSSSAPAGSESASGSGGVGAPTTGSETRAASGLDCAGVFVLSALSGFCRVRRLDFSGVVAVPSGPFAAGDWPPLDGTVATAGCWTRAGWAAPASRSAKTELVSRASGREGAAFSWA